ncbi:MAG TPA: DUF5806 family protein [Methanoregula sp.]|nr:DUF5806 family protein [Methanoregula sp.]
MDESVIQQEINKYKKFKKVDGATYRKVNQFLRKRTYITAREWALARLCTDFRTSGGAEMTFIGKHLPELVPFMEEPYSPQAVNQARHSFKKKVRKASATFFYGAMCGFFTTDELDDLLFEASEVSRFLLEVEGTTLDIDEEIDIEDRITNVMRSVGETAKTILRNRENEQKAQDTSGQESTTEETPLPVSIPANEKPAVPSINNPEVLQNESDTQEDQKILHNKNPTMEITDGSPKFTTDPPSQEISRSVEMNETRDQTASHNNLQDDV